MKRFAVALLALAVFQVITAPPSSAIFGQSQCEKMWDAIDSEEAVGKLLWQKYRTAAQEVDRVTSPTQAMWGRVASLAIPLYESDLRVYSLAMRNQDCFSAKSNADIRYMNQDAKEVLAAMKAILRRAQRDPNFVQWNATLKWTEIYPRYVLLRTTTG